MSRTICYGPKDVRAIEVRLYLAGPIRGHVFKYMYHSLMMCTLYVLCEWFTGCRKARQLWQRFWRLSTLYRCHTLALEACVCMAYQHTWRYERYATATPAYVANTPWYVARTPCTWGCDVFNWHANYKRSTYVTCLKRHTYVTCTLYKRKERSGAVARTLSTPCEREHLFFLCVREIGMLLYLASLFRGRFVPALAFWGRGRGTLRCCGRFPCRLNLGIRLCFGIPATILRSFPVPWHVVSMKVLERIAESSYTHAFYILQL